MYPNLFGIDNFSYLLMIIIGVAVAFFLVAYFIKINKMAVKMNATTHGANKDFRRTVDIRKKITNVFFIKDGIK